MGENQSLLKQHRYFGSLGVFMKKRIILSVFASFIFFSCNYQIPEKVAIKTKAQYSFYLGDFSQNFSDYISVATLDKQMNGNKAPGQTKINIYDYNPDGNDSVQKFLIDFKMKEIPVDVAEYLKGMDFSSQLNGQSFEKNVKTPALTSAPAQKTLHLPDISEKIRSTANFSVPGFPIAETGLAITIPPISRTINITSPDFKTMDFSSGSLLFSILPGGVNPSPDFHTSLKVELQTKTGEVISSKSGVDITTGDDIALPIAGKSIYPEMKLVVSGNASGGTLGHTTNFNVSSRFSGDTKLSKVTGLNMSTAQLGTTNIENSFNAATSDNFVECTIGENSYIKIISKLPEGWSGVKANPVISVSGALDAADSEFDKTAETQEFLLNRKLNLENKKFKPGEINAGGTLSIELKNATITFGDTPAEIKIDTQFAISKIKSITMDFTEIKNQLKADLSEALPVDVVKYVDYMKLGESGIKITYTNTFPAGNDVTIKAKSDFFGLDETKPIYSNKTDENFSLTGHEKTIHPASDNTVDFKVDFTLPPPLSPSPADKVYATLKDIELDKEYKLAVKVDPVFDWKEIGLKTDAVAPINYNMDMGLSFGSMFNEIQDKLGESAFLNNIYIDSIPVYLYCAKPEGLNVLDDLSFIGNIDINIKDEHGNIQGETIQLADGSKHFSFKPGKALVTDKNGIVINNIELDEYAFSGHLERIFNQRKPDGSFYDGTMSVNSSIKFSGNGGDPVVKIKKEELENLKSSAATSIKISARIVLPLKFEIKNKDIDIDILKLTSADPNQDLFRRTEATELDKINKYIDAIKSVEILYAPVESFISYEGKSASPKLVFDTNISSLAAPKHEFSINGGSVLIDIDDTRQILQKYPFTPKANFTFPKGKFYIRRNATVGANLAIKIKTDGTVPLFGD